MRVFAVVDPNSNSGKRPQVTLMAGARVWGVGEKLTLNADQREEREYEALAECVLLHAHEKTQNAPSAESHCSDRIVCAALDIPEQHLSPGNAEHGEWAHVLTIEGLYSVAAWLVSELGASDALASDYAPEMLWFDASEATDAAVYADGATL